MSNEYVRADFDTFMVPCYNPMPFIPQKGLGSKLWDQSGKEYIDFAGGIAVNCLGHCHPVMQQALMEQASKLWHVSNVMSNEPALKLADKLTQLSFAQKVFFTNSGAEANEAALKLARRFSFEKYGKAKSQIISFQKSFHGRTFFTVSVGGQDTYSNGFGPKPEDILHLEYNQLEQLKAHISDKTCAVIMEPILGEGGVVPASKEFVQGVRHLCDQFNCLLIFDEVQTGNGRTGHFYAYQSLGVIPDILTTAKSLGGGMPIGAMLTTNKIAQFFKVGTHGSTYGGNPLACAVAYVVIDFISKNNVLEDILTKEQWFRTHLNRLDQKFNLFDEIRGKGLLLGAKLNQNWKNRFLDIFKVSSEAGVLLLTAGQDVLRFTPSYLITKEEVDEGFKRLEHAISLLR